MLFPLPIVHFFNLSSALLKNDDFRLILLLVGPLEIQVQFQLRQYNKISNIQYFHNAKLVFVINYISDIIFHSETKGTSGLLFWTHNYNPDESDSLERREGRRR